jgi:signal transduction histidine kinase
LIDKKLMELNSSIEMLEKTGTIAMSVQLVRTGVGLRWMAQVRDEIEGIRKREREHIYQGIKDWQLQHTISRYMAAGAALLNVILLLVAGAYITRDIERRNAAVNELDRLVAQRTTELSELSTHLQRATEREKSQLARELHDELGGLLVAIKMDLAQLAKKFDITQPDIQPRWQRIQNAISAGVDLKRRVIEELRPTLLDNMGLIAALRWQAEQTCSQAGLTLEASFPDEEPTLDTNTSIAIFRVAQESLTNIVKHARATTVSMTLQIHDGGLTLNIADNGVGLPAITGRSDAHGLLSMKHRVQAIGGTFMQGPSRHMARGLWCACHSILRMRWRCWNRLRQRRSVRRTGAAFVTQFAEDVWQPVEFLSLVQKIAHTQRLGLLAILRQRVVGDNDRLRARCHGIDIAHDAKARTFLESQIEDDGIGAMPLDGFNSFMLGGDCCNGGDAIEIGHQFHQALRQQGRVFHQQHPEIGFLHFGSVPARMIRAFRRKLFNPHASTLVLVAWLCSSRVTVAFSLNPSDCCAMHRR